MANKKLTEEQQNQIKVLLANNEMLEKTKKEAEERGKKGSVSQIERAQQEVIDHINSIDPTALETSKKEKKKKTNTIDLFGDIDMSVFEDEAAPVKVTEEEMTKPATKEEAPMEVDTYANTETVIAEETMFNEATSDSFAQYDVIQLPSNGQCYKSKMDRIPVAYLTAYDENIITSPNLYKDGLVIDFLLKSKIVNKDINPDDLVSGDVDAITLFLRATSYGPEFPIVVRDPDTGEQIDTVVDLTTLKPREFKLVGDENGWFDYKTDNGDLIKFKVLSYGEETDLFKNNLLIEDVINRSTVVDFMDKSVNYIKNIDSNTKDEVIEALNAVKKWCLDININKGEHEEKAYSTYVTDRMIAQTMSINGNEDREFIKNYIENMRANDAFNYRKFVNENVPGVDLNVTIPIPESMGGGSFDTFLSIGETIFINVR